jgi:hypothetical protein
MPLPPADYTAQSVAMGHMIFPATKFIGEQFYCVRGRHYFRRLPVWRPQLFCYRLYKIGAPTFAPLASALASLLTTLIEVPFRLKYDLA